MMRRGVALVVLLLSVMQFQGCAWRREMPLDATLFPVTPAVPESRAAGRVAVFFQPQVKDLVHEGESGPARSLRVPVGPIIARAMLSSANEAFAGGAESLQTAAGDGQRYVATLIVQSLRVRYDSRLLWMIPLPLLGGMGDSEFDAHLALDVTALGPQGQVLWTRSYDDGRRIWQHEWTDPRFAEGLLRLTHEAAWRLAQQVMRDLREWTEGERLRPRNL
jgi:hypothetical protein